MGYDLSIPGWMTEKELQAIESIATNFKPRSVIEIGSLVGRSTVAWAASLPDSDIWTVDHSFLLVRQMLFAVVQDSDLEESMDCKFNFEDRNKALYALFLRYTQPYKNIRHIKIDSYMLPQIWGDLPKFDCCFIDGDHSAEGINRDLDLAKDFLLQPKGVIVLHDYGNLYLPQVEATVSSWSRRNFYSLATWPDTTIALLIPPKQKTLPEAVAMLDEIL